MASPIVTPTPGLPAESGNPPVTTLPDQPVVTSTSTSEPSVEAARAAEREAIYRKYYATDPPPPEAPTAPVVAAPPAPSAGPTGYTAKPADSPDVAALRQQLAAVQEQLAAVKGAFAPAAPAAPAPVADWIELLREGKIDEAKAALRTDVGGAVEQRATQNAVTQALEVFRAEQEIGGFLQDLRARPENSDVMAFEPYIVLGVEARINALRNEGKLSSVGDYVTSYKSAVQAELEKARTTVQSIRAAGKVDGMTVKREVVSTSALAPNSVAGAGPVAEPEIDLSPEAYLAARQAIVNRTKGLAPTI